MLYTLRFFFQNAVCFIIQTYLVPALFTFYIEDVLKLKNNSGVKRLIMTFPVAARSKAWACDCLLLGIVGSNPAWDMDVSLL